MIQTKFIEDYSNKEIIEKYLENFKSDQSKRMRKSSLTYFFSENHFNYDGKISEITTDILRDYHNFLDRLEDISLTTKKNKWVILTSFLQYCFEDYKTKNDKDKNFIVVIPSKIINWSPNHKEGYSNKNILATEDEIKGILNYLKASNFKHYIIFKLLIETGMRKGELIDSKISGINLESRYIKVYGKTGKKVYFYSQALSNDLKLYLEDRKKISSEYLFLTKTFKQYSNRVFNLILKAKPYGILNRLGIEKDITCHTFRRTLNTLRKRKMNCNNEDAKILLGHKTGDVNIESYTVYDYADKLVLFDKYNPYSNL